MCADLGEGGKSQTDTCRATRAQQHWDRVRVVSPASFAKQDGQVFRQEKCV